MMISENFSDRQGKSAFDPFVGVQNTRKMMIFLGEYNGDRWVFQHRNQDGIFDKERNFSFVDSKISENSRREETRKEKWAS